MRKQAIWMLGILATAGGLAAIRAADDSRKPVGITADYSFVSKYMAHGWNIGGDHPSHQPSVTVDALLPGLQFAYWANFPVDRDRNDFDEYDWLLKYNRTIFADEAYAMNLHGYVDYWLTPHSQSAPGDNTLTGWKYHAGVSFVNLIPLGDARLVPSYNIFYWNDTGDNAFESGAVNEFSLSTAIPLPKLHPSQSSGFLALSGAMNYNTGPFGNEEGWSHATAGLAVPMNWASGLSLTPSVNYQWSFEDTVNPENEFWWTLSLTQKF